MADQKMWTNEMDWKQVENGIKARRAEQEDSEDEQSANVEFETSGVRTMVENEARAEFTGSETALEVLERYKTRLVIESEAELACVLEIIRQTQDERDLTAGQHRMVRDVIGRLEETRATFWD